MSRLEIQQHSISFDHLYQKKDKKKIKIEKIKSILATLSSESDFKDNTWRFDLYYKTYNSNKSTRTAYFVSIPTEYLEIVKLVTLLYSTHSVVAAGDFPAKIKHFFQFCKENDIKLKDVNLKVFNLFEKYINELKNKNTQNLLNIDTRKKIWYMTKLFLSSINWHEELPYIESLKYRKTLNLKKVDVSDSRPPIETSVLVKLDNYFLEDNIALHFKLVYWFLRLFPKRISEVLNLKIDCLKELNDDFYLLNVPEIKNSGNITGVYEHSELIFKKEKYQNFLISLIKKQVQIAKKLQNDITEKNYLLSYQPKTNMTKPTVLTYRYFSTIFRQVQNRLEIVPNITIHQLRTTGTTLRAENGFTSLQLKELLHVNLESVAEYSKPRNDTIIKAQQKINATKEEAPRVYFKGIILNSKNQHIEKKIMEKPLAFRLPEMGFCSYENKCGSHFDCLECKYLIPDVDLKEYYRSTAIKEFNKSEYWSQKKNDLLSKDHFYRATLFAKLYETICMNEMEE